MDRLHLNHIVKRYGIAEILRDINLEIQDGEFVVFVGPSGAASPPCCAASPGWKRSAAATC